jgi:hypothetical protein
MSNLTNLGFSVYSNEEFIELAVNVAKTGEEVKVKNGSYVRYSDPSGAEIWVQKNDKNQLIGLNPHFDGKSKKKVALMQEIHRDKNSSPMDGSFHAWADPVDENEPESGAFPFVFDLPDFYTNIKYKLPKIVDIQLAAFASELDYFQNEESFMANQDEEPKWAAQAVVPVGLFNNEEEKKDAPPQATAMLTGIVKESKLIKNEYSKENFLWILVETLSGDIDIVADAELLDNMPKEGGIIKGLFWLSGRILS